MEVDLNELVCIGPATCVAETRKAWLVRRRDGSEIWFPRSHGQWAESTNGRITVTCFHATRWVLGKKGLVVEDSAPPPKKRAPSVRTRANALGMRLIAGGRREEVTA